MNALAKIQSEIKAPKGQLNKFGGYNYRSCEDILEAVKPLLKKHDAVLTISDSIEAIGNRVYVKATVRFEGGDGCSAEVTAYAREAENKKGMDEAQITGAASSYARKYALGGLLCLDDNKDADTNGYAEQQREQVNQPQQRSNGSDDIAKTGRAITAKLASAKVPADVSTVMDTYRTAIDAMPPKYRDELNHRAEARRVELGGAAVNQ